MKRTHGLAGTPIYAVWSQMKRRCTNPKDDQWERYGGRGITVCERWRDFQNFLEDMGDRPSSQHTVERLDNDKGYEPGNCKWATKTEQARNRRTNKLVEYDGRTQCVAAWAEEMGLDVGLLVQRLNRDNWTVEEALTTPADSRNIRSACQLTYQGKTQSLSAWAKELGLSRTALYRRRAAGWDVEDMLTTPTNAYHQKGRKSWQNRTNSPWSLRTTNSLTAS